MTSKTDHQRVPDLYHFIWIGSQAPYFLVLAIQSVILRCKNARVILWADDKSADFPFLAQLLATGQFEVKTIDVPELIKALEEEKHRQKISEIFDLAGTKSRLANTKPIERSRSNLLRYLILYKHGGVYLDADTLVLHDLSALNEQNAGYIGEENSIWAITRRKNPLYYFIYAPFLEVYRFLANVAPFGYEWNRGYRFLCGSSANNAVIGLHAGHPFLTACFDYICSMTMEEILRPLRLGPFLFQRVLKKYKANDLSIFSEKYFYPYGPLISQHYFKVRKNACHVKNRMVSLETYLLHWGASTKQLANYTPENLDLESSQSVFTLLTSEVKTLFEIKYVH